MSLTLVAAMTWPGRVIGKDNAIPWKLGADLKRFKALTLGHPVIMGRKTWESLPLKLPGRSNIVLSRLSAAELATVKWGQHADPDFCAGSLEAALAWAASAPGGGEIFVIGGASLYAETLFFADRLSLTLIHHPFEGDVLFPPLDLANWAEASRQRDIHAGEPSFAYEFLDLHRP